MNVNRCVREVCSMDRGESLSPKSAHASTSLTSLISLHIGGQFSASDPVGFLARGAGSVALRSWPG